MKSVPLHLVTFSDFNHDMVISPRISSGTPTAYDSEITSENHYYPFGLGHTGPWYASIAPENKYRYNGKEWNADWGLNMYDYGARWYMPDLGRWGQVDPMAERYYYLATFTYVGNMPMIAIDPTGEEIVIVANKYSAQVLEDLAKIYSTRLGRKIINQLAASDHKYKIDGSAQLIQGSYFYGTKYNRLTRTITYTQKGVTVDGAYSPSFIVLGHELYHAYQHETKQKMRSKKEIEGPAMKFENYLRDVLDDGISFGGHRTRHGNFTLSGFTAFNSDGEKVDVNSVRIKSFFMGGLNKESEDGGVVPRDNTSQRVSLMPVLIHILEFMDNNGIQELHFELNQRKKGDKKN